jgi:hypothetical protein
MKIEQLFDELKTTSKGTENVFADSGMINWSDKMKYGFFPLGMGVLTKNITIDSKATEVEIAEGGVMILGNDFGTVSYVENSCNGAGEIDSKTVNNLCNGKVGLDTNRTFFTNFYLGVRDDKTHKGTTMTKRIVPIKKGYKEFCLKFFIAQLDLLRPRIVICLGHDVRNAIADSTKSELFAKWKPKSVTMKKLYDGNENKYVIDLIESKEFGSRKFIVIPHPCDLRNFKDTHMKKLNELLNDC